MHGEREQFLRIDPTVCAGHAAANGNHTGKTRSHAGMNRSHAGETGNNTAIGRNAHELWTYDEDLRLIQQAGMNGCMENADLF